MTINRGLEDFYTLVSYKPIEIEISKLNYIANKLKLSSRITIQSALSDGQNVYCECCITDILDLNKDDVAGNFLITLEFLKYKEVSDEIL